MSELGMRLKNARVEKNLTLEQLQEMTKIQKRYLQAIEEGNLHLLPGNFYARAFVKSYSEAVGIDPEMLFEEHANELPASSKQVTEIPPRVQSKKNGSTKKTRRFLAVLPSVVAVVFIISILIGFWYFLQKNTAIDEVVPTDIGQETVDGGKDEEALKPEEEDEDEEETQLIEVEEIEDVEEELPEQELVFVETKGKETIYQLLNADEFKVEIELDGKSYIEIDNLKGKTFHASIEDSGKVLSFDFSEEESIHFNFGASNNVKLFINDEPFEFPLNIAHQKVTFHFQEESEQ
ncbi:hypothetical protein BKP45_20285 [Anaerobacillus alkalidiazotrophicus]|uniref:HTH cro/C1-type domain-containing protein n=1 Tax=Anaerobacillus alkalidiazotrophicus TaxID=472963 RepID=A0A1S2LZX2_9BACI|nr:hypothetical protein BKP45_20285 [Anaerobacillus alkalidiazotrophicus]